MKKLFSISIAFLLLIAGMHLTLATHFCEGKFASSKISVSGVIASCGMEETEDSCPSTGDHIKSHCCDDEVAVYTIENNYSPSNSTIIDLTQYILQVYYISVNFKFHTTPDSDFLLTNVSPPGNLMTSAISLVDICVFRN